MTISVSQIACRAAGAVAGSLGLTVMLPLALPIIGFAAIGPGAGTLAASAMSLYAGAVPAAGVVATAQSIAMGGAGVGTAMTGAILGSGMAAGLCGKDEEAESEEEFEEESKDGENDKAEE